MAKKSTTNQYFLKEPDFRSEHWYSFSLHSFVCISYLFKEIQNTFADVIIIQINMGTTF